MTWRSPAIWSVLLGMGFAAGLFAGWNLWWIFPAVGGLLLLAVVVERRIGVFEFDPEIGRWQRRRISLRRLIFWNAWEASLGLGGVALGIVVGSLA